jgi:hypothetical protein
MSQAAPSAASDFSIDWGSIEQSPTGDRLVALDGLPVNQVTNIEHVQCCKIMTPPNSAPIKRDRWCCPPAQRLFFDESFGDKPAARPHLALGEVAVHDH